MDEELKVLEDWDRLTNELAARSISTDVAWTVLQLADQRRMAAALERLTGIQGGRLNRDTLGLVGPDKEASPPGVMNSASLAMVFRARELLRQYATQPDLIEAEELLTRALANGEAG